MKAILIRLTDKRYDLLTQLSSKYGISRNKLVNMLVLDLGERNESINEILRSIKES